MRDDQLIFMISLPRSGSTMLQKILGTHSEIYTRSEPWLMLHPLYALKNDNIQTTYNARLAADGVHDFISGMGEDGESLYYQNIQSCYLSMYEPYLQSSGKSRFLDKTPRYYEVFDELQRTFPRAKFIIIYRNPLAVLNSILETWVKGRFELLKGYKSDLEQGLEFLTRDFSNYTNTYCVYYEELLASPEDQARLLFDFLELDFDPQCINYGKAPAEKWLYGDPKTVYEKDSPDAVHADEWVNKLSNPESYKVIAEYFQWLGKDRLEQLGYDADQLEAQLKEARETYSHPDDIKLSWRSLMRSEKGLLEDARKQLATLNNTVRSLRDRNKIVEDRLNESRELLKQKDIRIDDFHKIVQGKDLLNKDLNELIASKNSRIEGCQLDIKVRDEQLRALREENRARDDQIQVLVEEGKAQVKKLQEFAEQLEEKEKLIGARDEDLESVQSKVDVLEGLLKESVKEIQEKEREIEEKCARTERLEEVLDVLLDAKEELVAHKLLFSPRKKINAYRDLLVKFRAVRDRE
ncbi:sulfotransferase [Halopseudomonas phragmitis]|nr:sulfotransferase [Halopseudomonas phragmitis]